MYSLPPHPQPVHMCIGTCVAGDWGPEVDIMCLSKWLLTVFFLRQDTSLNLELASEIQGVTSPLSASLVGIYGHVPLCPALYMGTRGSTQVLEQVLAWPAEPSPQPEKISLSDSVTVLCLA